MFKKFKLSKMDDLHFHFPADFSIYPDFSVYPFKFKAKLKCFLQNVGKFIVANEQITFPVSDFQIFVSGTVLLNF
jgi:hypothetical protein